MQAITSFHVLQLGSLFLTWIYHVVGTYYGVGVVGPFSPSHSNVCILAIFWFLLSMTLEDEDCFI